MRSIQWSAALAWAAILFASPSSVAAWGPADYRIRLTDDYYLVVRGSSGGAIMRQDGESYHVVLDGVARYGLCDGLVVCQTEGQAYFIVNTHEHGLQSCIDSNACERDLVAAGCRMPHLISPTYEDSEDARHQDASWCPWSRQSTLLMISILGAVVVGWALGMCFRSVFAGPSPKLHKRARNQ